FVAVGGVQRAPVLAGLVSPAVPVLSRPVPGKDRVGLHIGAGGLVGAGAAVGAQGAPVQVVELGGGGVGGHGRGVVEGDHEGGVGAALAQVDVVDLRGDGLDRAQQPHQLVDHVGAEIAQQATVRARLELVGLIEVEAGVHPPQVPEPSALEHAAQGADIG